MALLYALLISGTLSAAGLAGDLTRSLFRRSARGVWLLILIVSSAGPIAMMRWTKHEPAALEYQRLSLPLSLEAENTEEQGIESGRRQGSTAPTAPFPDPSHRASATINETAGWSLDQLVAQIWIVLSIGAIGVISIASLTVRRRAGQWTADQLQGIPVRISDDVGPAVIGILRPYIVVPRWLLLKSAPVQRVALMHELEHMRARDPVLWRFGLALAVLTPWNPIVWWQLHKLRFAIERDCDQRVLRRGIDSSEYGRALLDVAQSQAASPFGAVALTERASQLEQRIRSILKRPHSYGYRATCAVFAGLAMVGCIGLAAEVRPPGAMDPATLFWPPEEDRSSFLAVAEAVAKERYPALFAGRLTRTVLISVDLLYDGTVLATSQQEFPPGPLAGIGGRNGKSDPQSFNEMIGWRNEGVLAPHQGDYHLLAWFGPKRSNGLYVSYHVLKWPPDPERNTAKAELAVSAKYPDYFKSYPVGDDDFRTVKTLTVLLGDDGRIAQAEWGRDDANNAGEDAILSHFRAMGLEPSSLAHWGDFGNWEWNMHAYDHVPPLRVFYAWPRNRRDPVFNEALLRKVKLSEERSMRSWESTNRSATRLVKFYFPGVWAHGSASSNEGVWFLLDQSGTVIDRGYGNTGINATALHSPERHPGIRIGDFVNAGVETMNGRTVRASFEWLRADSPPP